MKYKCDCGNELVLTQTNNGASMVCAKCGNVEWCPKENEYDKKAIGKITN
jgi:hypothetical protein